MTLNITTATADHTFTLYSLDTKFNRIAGIYIFLIIPPISEVTVAEVLEARHPELIEGQHYSLLYAGITNNFRGRFNQHHKIEQAKSLGMTHIGIFKASSIRKRKKIEREILQYLNPPLNQTWLNDIPSSPFGG